MTDQTPPAPKKTGPNVLIVEDDHFLLDMYSMKFSQDGFTVESCQSVSEAVAALKAGLQPAAVLFDIVMPGEDGFSLLRTLKTDQLGKGACLIALTNQSSDADRKQALDLGVDQYVVKASMIPSEVVAMTKECIAKMQPQNSVNPK